MKTFDAIIIGDGQAGNPLSQQLAGQGWKVALIERLYLGGSCINYGCTPTKKMLASARVAHLARRGPEFGVQTGEVKVDLARVVAMKNELVEMRRSSMTKRAVDNENVTLLCGEARFTGDHRLAVDGEEFSAQKIFINTGSRPHIPQVEGLDGVPYFTNENIMDLTELPEHLLIMGAGYIGLEFGQMFLRFGSQVTMIGNKDRIAPQEDPDISQALREALEKEGLQFRLNTQVEQVGRGAGGEITLRVKNTQTGQVEMLTGSHLLVAVGHRPNSEALNPQAAGIHTDERGNIPVNEYLETNIPGIYALGDVTGGPKFTHISYNDFQIVYHNLFHKERMSIKDRIVPYALYTDPELGRVGMSETQARRAGKKIMVGTYPMNYVARAIERQETEGFMKIVVDAETDQILGAAILSAEGGELVQTLMGLMMAKAPWTVFKQAVFIHPTLTEGFFGLMESVKE